MESTAFVLIIAAVLQEVLGQVCVKRGIARLIVASSGHLLTYWCALALDSWVQIGVALQLIGLLLWIAALNLAPLSIAFPLGSLSYCGVAIASHLWLGETIGRRSIAAIVLITIGAALVGFASP